MRTAQVPFPIVQGEIFLPVTNPVSPYERKWTNALGDRCTLFAPRTPNHYDLVSLLVFLHVIQGRNASKTVFNENRYRVVFPMRYMYEVLQLRATNQREDLFESLVRLSQMSFRVRYKNPSNHNDNTDLVLAGFTGDLKRTRQRGRAGNILEAYPLRELVDLEMLTVDLDRIIALRSPLAKITAFFMQCREHKALTWGEWMRTISTSVYLKSFKQKFTVALRELEAQRYRVVIDGNVVKITR